MISTANYVARKYGVRSAMPGFIARELCPQLVFAKSDFGKYTAASRASRVIFADYDAEFSAGSLDEAHLDVTDYCQQHGVTGAPHSQHWMQVSGRRLRCCIAAALLISAQTWRLTQTVNLKVFKVLISKVC